MPGLAMLGVVDAEVTRAGKTSTQQRFHLSSVAMDTTRFAAAVRAHWRISQHFLGGLSMPGVETFSWVGTVSTDWNTPANWADITSGQTPAIAVPGSLDVVIITNDDTLSGNGSAASVVIAADTWRPVTDLGNLDVGTLAVGFPDALSINSGATIHAGTVADLGNIAVGGSNAVLLVDGTITVDPGAQSMFSGLTAWNNGKIEADSLNLVQGEVSDGGFGTIEIGNQGTANAEGLTVDPGHMVSGTGLIDTPMIVNGVILAASGSLQLGQPWVYASQTPPEDGEWGGYLFDATLSGVGTVEASSGSSVFLAAPVSTAGLTFQLDGDANLWLEASVSSGNCINLLGGLNTLTINDQYFVAYSNSGVPITVPFQPPPLRYTGGPPLVNATITGFNVQDAIIFDDDASNNITLTSVSYNGSVLSLMSGTSIVSNLTIVGDYSGLAFDLGDVTGSTSPALSGTQQTITLLTDTGGETIACFVAGTRIATPCGPIAIENLQEGDLVLTARGQSRPIQWIGRRRVDCLHHPTPRRVTPVRIAPHAFGPRQPERPLLLSPDHAIFVDEVLIPIKCLVNETTIVQTDPHAVTYYHIELPHHDVVLAEGMPVESYLETGGRQNFDDAGPVTRLHPDFSPDPYHLGMIWENEGFAPLVVTGEILDRVRARLSMQATLLNAAAL